MVTTVLLRSALSIALVTALFARPAVAEPDEPPVAVNVRDFGAKADGVTDATSAFQSALDAAGKTGAIVHVPAGRYYFTGHIRVPGAVSLVGSWQGPPSREEGTVLLVTEGEGQEDGTPFITLMGAASIKGLVISYPNQKSDSEPVPYPWTVRGLAQDCQVHDTMLIRSYQGIDFGTYPCSRHYINNLYGSPLRRGIYVDGSVDVGRISNVHFTTWGFQYRNQLYRWRQQHGEAFVIAKADWMWINNCFGFGWHVGFHFIEGTGGNEKRAGAPNYVQISHSGMDDTEIPMLVDRCNNLSVSQCVFKGHAIRIGKNNTHPVRFSQCNFSPEVGTASLVEAAGKGRVSFTDCTFEFWDTVAGDLSPALRADCASLLVQGCEFGTDNRPSFVIGDKIKRHIELTSSVKSAVIAGNRFRFGQNILNNSKGDVVISGNVTDEVDLPEFGGAAD